MGVASTPEVTGRQLPLQCLSESLEPLPSALEPRLPGLTRAAQKDWKNTGVLAGVADCGRSQKWGCRGRFAPGFKNPGVAAGGNHVVSRVERGLTPRFWGSLNHTA